MRYITAKETAVLIRKTLKVEFDGTKFSVRTSTYSGGSSIDISWTDGPSQQTVDAITDGFEGKGSIDAFDHVPSKTGTLEGEVVQYMADYVLTHRGVSDEQSNALKRELSAAMGEEAASLYASYPVPEMIYRECPNYRYSQGTITNFITVLSEARAA